MTIERTNSNTTETSPDVAITKYERGTTRPLPETVAKQDPTHTKRDFLRDLDRASKKR